MFPHTHKQHAAGARRLAQLQGLARPDAALSVGDQENGLEDLRESAARPRHTRYPGLAGLAGGASGNELACFTLLITVRITYKYDYLVLVRALAISHTRSILSYTFYCSTFYYAFKSTVVRIRANCF